MFLEECVNNTLIKTIFALADLSSCALAQGTKLETLLSNRSLVDANKGYYIPKTMVLRKLSVQGDGCIHIS
jgi:hypothetical protein